MSSKASLDDKVQSCLKNKQKRRNNIKDPKQNRLAFSHLEGSPELRKDYSLGGEREEPSAQVWQPVTVKLAVFFPWLCLHLSCSSIPELGPPCPLVSSALGKTTSVLDS